MVHVAMVPANVTHAIQEIIARFTTTAVMTNVILIVIKVHVIQIQVFVPVNLASRVQIVKLKTYAATPLVDLTVHVIQLMDPVPVLLAILEKIATF